MSSRRAAAPPPHIPGYRYASLLGSGGFSDVYLYEQDRPRRKVAVKVLVSGLLTEGARRAFESEANLMAQLSTHPYIVTIYEANVTEDGHSYLAMEYCSRPSLDVRYRRGRLSLAETLTIGIQVASAVESAHRAGIVHRDIKPANILVTDYNRPALTDFGISGTTDGPEDEDLGMSIPWSPPEAFHGGSVDGIRMDVWSLGATVYTLLAGRSPFVFPGMDNAQGQLMDRIGSMPLARIGRDDVPESLELALATAMAKNPASRYNSAHSFALTLQRIQTELGISVTPFEVLDDTEHVAEDDDDVEATRVRKVVSIDPESSTFAPTFPTAAGTAPATSPRRDVPPVAPPSPVTQSRTESAEHAEDAAWRERTVLRGSEPLGDSVRMDTTVNRPASAEPEAGIADDGTPARRRGPLVGVLVGLVLLVAVVVGVLAIVNGQPEDAPTVAPPTQAPADALAGVEGVVPVPVEIAGVAAGNEVVFTWTNPSPEEGDVYRFRTVTVQDEGEWDRTVQTEAEVVANPDGPTCVDVQIVRANGTASEPVRACLPE
ncbi:serine/threonine protein kinase [Arthrobacter pigmenti]|uniref:non-specific serine/threonine protein kinase n=1 Tax=Arthrobacter pigmenti TaxID=271432 RepID=A0A846RL30_9MICC|nr:serine/threonine-protein kinase [Arthrobacter pigmenti]NJC21829.1 serine/threonine protein kinase [Arthrobacter pigmenti]